MRANVLSAVLVGLVIAAAAPAAAETKVAVIDVQRVVTESDPGKGALQKLKQLQDQKMEAGKGLQQELDALRDRFNKQRFTLAEDKLRELEKQVEDKTIVMKRFQDDASRELEETRRRELDALEQRIMPIIDQLGKEQGLTLIFNKFQSGLVYADDAVDITDDVIRRFNTAE
jgi:outer membrane protein